MHATMVRACGLPAIPTRLRTVDDDVKQEYRQNDAKSAAAAGAVVGGSAQRRDRRQAAAQTSAGSQAFDSAYRSCLTARGYTVQ